MRILYISPSSGDTYFCGNCYRDSLLARSLKLSGHDVVLMPLYLPLSGVPEDVPVFFPATTYYIEQALYHKRPMPGWLQRLTSARPLLRLASSLSGTTSAAGMEGMTLEMIEGTGTAFRDQVDRLIGWVRASGQPDVIHLSSSLLIGIARALKEALDVPVACSLQDEEVWLDSLREADAARAWQGVLDNASSVDAFVVSSDYYRRVVERRLPGLGPLYRVYPGVEVGKYLPDSPPDRPTIGFFYRMNELDGLDILAEAFVLLKRRGSIPGLQLRIGGGAIGAQDRRSLARVRDRLAPYAEDVHFEPEYDPRRHHEFYRQVSVLSVPLRFDEGIGLYLCEAFAAGVPAVQPATGSFPEVVDGAGVLYAPNDAEHLAGALERLLGDPERYLDCRQRARELARTRYNAEVAAQNLLNIYGSIR